MDTTKEKIGKTSELITETDFASKKEDLLNQFAKDQIGKNQIDTLAKLEQLKALTEKNMLTEADIATGKERLAQAVNVTKELTLMEGNKNKMRHLQQLYDEQVIDSKILYL